MKAKEQPLSKLPRAELIRRLRAALQMLNKIAGNKESWTLSEARRVIADISEVPEVD